MLDLPIQSVRHALSEFGLHRLERLGRLALVGLAATALYAALAWSGTVLLGLASPVASVFAYAMAAVPSYCGHRLFTFDSTRPHREAAPRFAGLILLGYGTALVLPLLLTEWLGAPPLVAILVVCVAVPAFNAVALSRIVFRAPLLRPRGSGTRGA